MDTSRHNLLAVTTEGESVLGGSEPETAAERALLRFKDVELKRGMIVLFRVDPSNRPRFFILCEILQVVDGEPVTCDLRHCAGSAGHVFEGVRQSDEIEIVLRGQVLRKHVNLIEKYEPLSEGAEIQVYLRNWETRTPHSKPQVAKAEGDGLNLTDERNDDCAWYNAIVTSVNQNLVHGILYSVNLQGLNHTVSIRKVRYECIRPKPIPGHKRNDEVEVFMVEYQSLHRSGNPFVLSIFIVIVCSCFWNGC